MTVKAVHFWPDLTQFFSWQQTDRFLVWQDCTNSHFCPETNFYMAEMKLLLKPSQRIARKELRQEQSHLPFSSQSMTRKKRLSADWKIYESGPLDGGLP